MKITICGSMVFYKEMVEVKNQLESMGHEAKTPPGVRTKPDGTQISSIDFHKIRHNAKAGDTWIWEEKQVAVMDHFKKIAWADAILVLNYDKNGIVNYIGANTLMEMGVAFYLGKKIYLLNSVPEMPYIYEEVLGMRPILLNKAKAFADIQYA